MSLHQDKIQEIEAKAMEVLTNLNNGGNILPPVDLTKILKAYNLTLKMGKFDESNVSGAFDRKNNTIFVSESEPYNRQAFTIAHELGHFILHEDKQVDTFYRTDSLKLGEKKDEKELEADWFAAALLMPKMIVERFWTVSHDIEHMARLFGVSSIAMRYRLKHLGLME